MKIRAGKEDSWKDREDLCGEKVAGNSGGDSCL